MCILRVELTPFPLGRLYGSCSVSGQACVRRKGLDELMAAGGGIITIPPDAPENMAVVNDSQQMVR